MSIFSGHFPLGLGTTRFPVTGPKDTVGLDASIKIVLSALERGIDYIDIAHNYAAGMAPFVLREAFRQTKRPFSVTAKVRYGEAHTADDARKCVEHHLNSMGLDHARYFTCWCIWNYSDFEQITKKGGIYDGALKLKDEGVIDHICCSVHAPPGDIMKIIDSGAFEGITISYSVLNASLMRPVLDLAHKKDIGIAVMNPLGGGLIAQNRDYFSFICEENDNENTVHAALRFVKAHPAVDVVLGGVSNQTELEDSISVFSQPDGSVDLGRLERVTDKLFELKGFCTGCNYCAGCPKEIPTSAIMRAHNTLLFQPTVSYNRREPDELLYNLALFQKLYFDNAWIPESAENPCIQCGRCAKKCTQGLDIISGVDEIYRRAKESGFSHAAQRQRLTELLYQKEYRSVGLYPNGGFSGKVIQLYRELYGEPDFEWFLFNSDPKTWGQSVDGLVVHAPTEIPELRPDVILITTYRFDQEIAESLQSYGQKYGIPIIKLHEQGTVPWIF